MQKSQLFSMKASARKNVTGGRSALKTDEKKQKRRAVLAVVFSILLLIAFFIIYYGAYETYIASEQKVTVSHFSEMTTGGRALVQSYIGRLTDGAEGTAGVLSYLSPDNTTFSYYFMQELPNRGAQGAVVETADGTVIYNGAGSFPDDHHRTRGQNGKLVETQIAYWAAFSATISEAFETENGYAISGLQDCGGTKYFCLAVPVKLRDGRSAALALFYPQSVLNELMDQAPTSNTARMCIMDSNGNFVAMQTMQEKWVTANQFILDSETSNRLTTVTSLSDNKQYVVYAKSIGINDWYILYAMPKDVLEAQTQAGSNRIHLFGTICLLFGIVVFGIGLYKNRVRSHHLDLFREKFRIATLQSARAAFEYDKKKDSICLISECEHIHFPKEKMTLSELAACVHPADRAAYGQSVIELRRDNTTATNVRCIHFADDDVYRWYHVTATRLADKGAGSAITIGTVEDIDESEKERLVLAQKATTDCLTGLCNRAETEQIIKKRLSELSNDERSVFAIFDLDDFKKINDVYGHDCGDRALLFFADKLRGTFRFDDVIGRLGGDEFVVYMSLTGDKKVLERRIQEFMDSLQMRRSDDAGLPPITCSVGCCIAARGDNFEDLYKHADTALYESKTRGKGLATIA